MLAGGCWLVFFSFFISFSVFKFFFLRCISTVQGEKSASMLTICCSVYRSGRSTESISTRSSIDRPRARSLSNQPGICRGSGTSSMRRRRPRRKRQSRTRRNWLRRRQQLDRKRGLMGGFFFTGLALKIFYLSWQNRLLQTPSFTMKLAGRKQDSLGYELMLFMQMLHCALPAVWHRSAQQTRWSSCWHQACSAYVCQYLLFHAEPVITRRRPGVMDIERV